MQVKFVLSGKEPRKGKPCRDLVGRLIANGSGDPNLPAPAGSVPHPQTHIIHPQQHRSRA